VSFLLDTYVVSEWIKARPNEGVVSWLAKIGEDQTFLSVVTLTELRHAIERMAHGARKARLDSWIHQDLLRRFDGRILPVDLMVADECGRLLARSEAAGHPIEARDAFIAATAEVYELTLVTRNVAHFRSAVKSIFMPWT
jgi:toxin FitB